MLVGVDWNREGVDIAISTLKKLNVKEKDMFNLTIIGLEKPESFSEENVIFKGKLDKNNSTQLELL